MYVLLLLVYLKSNNNVLLFKNDEDSMLKFNESLFGSKYHRLQHFSQNLMQD